jgi:uncharacterized CHY-type Zn-finger protein
MTKFQNSYLVDNFAECDGCNNLFHEDEIIASVQEPYYACQDCENDLIEKYPMKIGEEKKEKNVIIFIVPT